MIEIKSYIAILRCLGPVVFHKTAVIFLLEDEGTTSLQMLRSINSASQCHVPKDLNLQQHWCENLKFHTEVIQCFLSSHIHDRVYSHQYKQRQELQWNWSLLQECQNSWRRDSILFVHNMQQMVLKGGSAWQYTKCCDFRIHLNNVFSAWAWEFGSVRIRKQISPTWFVWFRWKR